MNQLSELSPGSVAQLEQLGGERSFRRRLMELGLLPGTKIKLVRRNRIGDQLELEVRGCHLSLRCSDAKHLIVRKTLG
ncbi:MAG: Fe2+ transport system protein FeoA [Planctomycetota bacterium]|jgi:Fe2+ transport system protein FeoA